MADLPWKTLPAEQFCLSVRDGTHDSPKPALAGKRLITSRHIIGGRIELGNAYLISELDFAEINRRSKVDQWDVLITMIGTVGEPCLVSEIPDFAIKNIGLFKSKDALTGKWLYYFLRTPHAQSMIKQRTSGTTQAYIALGTLRNFPITAPTCPDEMRSIVNCLTILDSKIELNRRMNETLEAMARALFRDWVVDFGPTRAKMTGIAPYLSPDLWSLFPDSLDDAGKPEGWEAQPLTAFFAIIGGGTPKTSNPTFWGGPIPWFSVTDTPAQGSVFVTATEKTITKAGLAGSSARLIAKGTTIISARGTVGNLAVAGGEMTFNQSCYGLSGSGPVGDCATYLIAQNMVSQLQSMAHGSVFSTITRQTFEALSLPMPSPHVLSAFEHAVAPLFEMILANVNESRTLAQTRDLLLPRLMSGELRVAGAERAAEAVL